MPRSVSRSSPSQSKDLVTVSEDRLMEPSTHALGRDERLDIRMMDVEHACSSAPPALAHRLDSGVKGNHERDRSAGEAPRRRHPFTSGP
jgi:hypothetical protein